MEREEMYGRTILRIVLGLIVVALAVGVGVTVYQAGIAEGFAAGAQVAARDPSATAPLSYWYGPYARPWGFGWGFHPFGLVFPLLLFLLFFGLFRGFGRARYWGHDGYRQPPAAFEEWHRRAHEPQATEPSAAPDR